MNEAPVVSLDHKELSEHEESKASVTTIVCREKWAKYIAACVARAKGSTECARRIVECLDSFGYVDTVLKFDNESVIKVLRDEVANEMNRPTRPVGPVPMHPQTHGCAEKAVQDLAAQVREFNVVPDKKFKTRVSVEKPIVQWLVERAAVLPSRHKFGNDRKTVYRRVNQRGAPTSQFEVGEQVMARFAPKRAKTKRKAPSAPRPTFGTWVAVHEPIDENIVALHSGKAARARTALRRPELESWSFERVLQAKATICCPNSTYFGELTAIFRFEAEDDAKSGGDLPDVTTHDASIKKRNFKMAKWLFEENGYINGCVGCEAMRQGASRRSSSAYCRARISEDLIKIEDDGRTLGSVEDRLANHRGKIVVGVGPIEVAIAHRAKLRSNQTMMKHRMLMDRVESLHGLAASAMGRAAKGWYARS